MVEKKGFQADAFTYNTVASCLGKSNNMVRQSSGCSRRLIVV